VDPPKAAHDARLDVGSARYHDALGYLIEEAALVGDEHTAFDAGEEHPHGYALYLFTPRALKLLEG
jgi:hypothetical protein